PREYAGPSGQGGLGGPRLQALPFRVARDHGPAGRRGASRSVRRRVGLRREGTLPQPLLLLGRRRAVPAEVPRAGRGDAGARLPEPRPPAPAEPPRALN